MANEIHFAAPTAGTYAAFLVKGNQCYDGDASLATLNAANKALGAISLTRQGTTLDYLANFPAALVTAGVYTVEIFISDGSPDGTESAIATGRIHWDGSAEVVPPTGAGVADWSSGEREQIRSALGIDGTKTTATGGQLQTITTATDTLEASATTMIAATDTLEASATTLVGHVDTLEASATTIQGYTDTVEAKLTEILASLQNAKVTIASGGLSGTIEIYTPGTAQSGGNLLRTIPITRAATDEPFSLNRVS